MFAQFISLLQFYWKAMCHTSICDRKSLFQPSTGEMFDEVGKHNRQETFLEGACWMQYRIACIF